MSSPFDLIFKIRSRGIKVWVEGNNLRVSKSTLLTEDDLDVLRKNKLELIKALSEPSQPEPEPVEPSQELADWKPYSVCCWCNAPIVLQRETETHFESILVDNITVDHRGCIVCASCHTPQSRKMKDGRLVEELVAEIEIQVGGAIPLQPSKEDQYLE